MEESRGTKKEEFKQVLDPDSTNSFRGKTE